MKDKVFYRKHTLNLDGKVLDLSSPKVMGILNITPDSFFDGGKNKNLKSVLDNASKMLFDGASILDVGGYSSRPGATDISIEEEIARIVPVIKALKLEFPEAAVSIDTFRAEVAQSAIDAGACLVNDISGGELDSKMFDTIAKNKVAYVLMHMKGTPQNMQLCTSYENIELEIMDYFQKKLYKLHSVGVNDIVLDVGFGFAKTIDQNYYLLNKLELFESLNTPILVGISRKSMIYKRLGTTAENALNGTTALNMLALQNGANLLRVHDIKEVMETVKLNYNISVLN